MRKFTGNEKKKNQFLYAEPFFLEHMQQSIEDAACCILQFKSRGSYSKKQPKIKLLENRTSALAFFSHESKYYNLQHKMRTHLIMGREGFLSYVFSQHAMNKNLHHTLTTNWMCNG